MPLMEQPVAVCEVQSACGEHVLHAVNQRHVHTVLLSGVCDLRRHRNSVDQGSYPVDDHAGTALAYAHPYYRDWTDC